MSLLALKNITKSFSQKKVLHQLNLTVERGELLVILGPSGHGKTKMLEIIAGLEKPDSGAVFFQGKKTGFVFQDYALFPHLTVLENIFFGLNVQKMKPDPDKTAYLLAILNLQELTKQYPHQLSGGQQQRVALARALIIEPELLLLDEPFSALDAQLRYTLRLELKQLVQKLGLTTIFVTHDQIEAYTLADRIAILYRGKIVQSGTPKEIFSKPQNKIVADFLGLENVYPVTVAGNSLLTVGKQKILAKSNVSTYESAFCWIRPQDISLTPPDTTPKTDHVFIGTIKNMISFPTSTKFYVEIGGELGNLVVDAHPAVLQEEQFSLGQLVNLSFAKEDVYLFNR